MSRERKENIECSFCNRTGIKFITEEYRNGCWNTVSSAISEGWRYKYGYLLCPKCSNNPKVLSTINQEARKDKKQTKAVVLAVLALLLGLFAGFALAAGAYIFGIPFLLLSLLFIVFGIKQDAGCGVLSLIAIIALIATIVYKS
jgi:hypothetical protein